MAVVVMRRDPKWQKKKKRKKKKKKKEKIEKRLEDKVWERKGSDQSERTLRRRMDFSRCGTLGRYASKKLGLVATVESLMSR